MDHATDPVARSLDDFVGASGVVATFHAGSSGQSHQWKLRSASGAVLAQTERVHRGGRFAQAFWRLWNRLGMHVGDDIHVELRGAQDCLLAQASSDNAWPATVTVLDEAGTQVVRSSREKETLTLYGGDENPIAKVVCEGDGPWSVTDASGTVLGELLAGDPGASTSPGLAEWVLFTDVALSSAAYRQGQHLGIRRVVSYAFAPKPGSAGGEANATALHIIPLIAGLTY